MVDTPKLSQFIGDGARTEGFAEMVSFVGSLKDYGTDLDDDTRRLIRFMSAVSIACVEIAAQEWEQDNDATAKIIHAMTTGTAIAMTSAVLSVLRDDTPAAALRAIVISSFEAGLDQTIKSNGLK